MGHTPEYRRAYYLANKPRIAARKAYLQKHDLDYRMRAVLATIVQRCNDPRHATYRWYGGKGVTTDLTHDQLKFMWERDGAAQMRKPTVDREDSNGNYTFSNCCFRELRANQKRGEQARRGVQVRQSLHAKPATQGAI